MGQREGEAGPRRLILFNLFALEGFHIAEALGVPCVAASPCLVPYAMPASFERSFQIAHPELYRSLQAAPEEPDKRAGSGGVSWDEVRHWMWPLFTMRWGPWRYHRFGLPEVPYSNKLRQLPPAPPLLYEGDAADEGPTAGGALSHVPAPVCVDFGSMGAMGLLGQPARLLRVLASAAELLRGRFVVLAGGWPQLAELASPPSDLHSTAPLLVLSSPVAHDVLLPHCAALLHHGGSGTVAAALRCGTPQLVCPLHFDQHSWAERVSWMGCGAQLSTSVLFPPAGSGDAAPAPPAAAAPAAAAEGGAGASQGQGLKATPDERQAAETLAAALRPFVEEGGEARVACRALQQALAGENGSAVAVQHILQYLQQDQQYKSQAEQAQQQQQLRRPQQPVTAVTLPNGLAISCLSPSEALLIYEEVWELRCYLRHGIQVPQAGVVVDVGANIGLFSLHVLQEAAAQGDTPATAGSGDEGAGNSRGRCSLAYITVAQQQQEGQEAGREVTPASEPAQQGALPTTATEAAAGKGGPLALQVFAFEPVPQIAELLQQNIAASGLSSMVTVIPQALYSYCNSLPITYYPSMPGNSTAKPAEKWAHQRPHMTPAAATGAFQGAQEMPCQATTLAAFVREQGLQFIDLLKVDVEGCELEVLQGMDDHCWAITHQVVVEVSQVEGRLDAIKQLLRQHGFQVLVEDGHLGGNALVYALRGCGAGVPDD
ncbi:hypothetical protein N2152v2_003018 [Parachlorella kessleri]